MLSKRHNVGPDDDKSVSPLQDHSQPLPSIEEIKVCIFLPDFQEAFKATQAAQKILSCEQYPPIDILIEAGICQNWLISWPFSSVVVYTRGLALLALSGALKVNVSWA